MEAPLRDPAWRAPKNEAMAHKTNGSKKEAMAQGTNASPSAKDGGKRHPRSGYRQVLLLLPYYSRA